MVVTDKEATGYNFSLNYPHYAVDPVSTVDDYRDMLIKNLYSGMMNSRFRETSQKENAPFVYAFAGFESYAKGYESFNVSASSGTNDIMKSVDAVAEEIERVKRYGFTQAELDRSRKNLLSSYERSWNNRDKNESQNYAEEYVGNFTDQEPAPGIQKEFEYVKQLLPGISIEEVNKLTDTYKNEKNRFAYITGPVSSPSYTLPADKEILAVIDAKATMPVSPYEEKQISSSLIATAITPGKIVAVSKNNLLGTTECTLSNGITVVLKTTDFKDDQIVINVGRYGGTNGYGVADKYSAENASAIISTMGIGEFSPTDLRKVLAGKSVSVYPFISTIKEGFSGNSGNKDLETMFQLIYLYATAPRKDSSLFSAYIQKTKAQVKLLDANPEYSFYDTINRVLYNNSPLAPTTIPKAENFDKISLSRVFQIYQERLGDMSGMKVNIVGSFKEKEILPLIEKYIASLPSSGKKVTYTDNRLREVKGKVDFRFYKGKEEKSEIVQVFSSEFPYNPQTAMTFSVLSEILNIKIIEELREKIQGIYGGSTYSTTEKAPYPHYQFSLELPCGPAKVDTLLKAFRKELGDNFHQGSCTIILG
jgi:zinc protease